MLSQYSGPSFVPKLNRVLERLNNMGLWKGILNQSFYLGDVTLGYITLSRYDEAVVGVASCCGTGSVFSQFYDYSPNGYGFLDESKRGYGNLLVDQGNGFVTQRNITGIATLRVKLEDPADANKVIRFFGSLNGREIYSASGIRGFDFTTISPSGDTSQTMDEIRGIQAPFMQGYWTLWQVIDGVESQIGVYAPGEKIPNYRRYKTGILNENTRYRLLCRRRFVPVVAPSDWVIPGCTAAIQFGLQALTQEDAGRSEDADVLWARATRELDNDLAALRGSAQTTIKVVGDGDAALWGGWGGVGNGYGYYGGGFVN